MGRTALLPLRRKCVLGIFITHKNPELNGGFFESWYEYYATERSFVICRFPLHMHYQNGSLANI
jgi:hypothetical protein